MLSLKPVIDPPAFNDRLAVSVMLNGPARSERRVVRAREAVGVSERRSRGREQLYAGDVEPDASGLTVGGIGEEPKRRNPRTRRIVEGQRGAFPHRIDRADEVGVANDDRQIPRRVASVLDQRRRELEVVGRAEGAGGDGADDVERPDRFVEDDDVVGWGQRDRKPDRRRR